MSKFLEDVKQAMVLKGWGPASASAEISYDPDHFLELHAEGMSAGDVADEVIRQANNRQQSVAS